ncbi:MAG TPA: hypothetical protein DGG94_09300 [Micromonosporaceae bacterium]|nr:hypothetical protein [Micromonosporaceae bacterium]HCU49978.1 hypothetical protein [Micromonosporaceae bacterium]
MYFFVSHAQGDDDHYVQEFFDDLCAEVGTLIGASRKSAIGFLGTDSGRPGGEWPPAMAEALSTCQVFIPLCSPRLFLSNLCGKQWWIFSERLRRYTEETGRHADSLISLMWAQTEVPLGFVSPDPGQPDRSLRQYLRLRSLRHSYRLFMTVLAKQIVATARDQEIPSYGMVPKLAVTRSAFAVADARTNRPLSPGAELRHGRRVHFVIASGSREVMSQVPGRHEADTYYGSQARDWAPYRPAVSRPLADQAQAVAATRLLDSHIASLEHLPERMEQADEHNEIVVLLVDPWAPRVAEFQRVLAEADHEEMTTTAVLVASNREDRDTLRELDELQFEVRQTFPRNSGKANPLFRLELQTADQFDAELGDILEAARNRVFRNGRVHHVPPGNLAGERPILSGP